ncbi:MAG: HU family DNA-binding protein [Hydrococcus sp. RU_2_2]|nr:HU family DNA-binding protein [Hydrococcus sp. RU_2_2]NJP19855.1 HU family DNA-binding protein [Hydrococcus sp. CRU_1_1]NJQ97960.1 HU family DNA-binding protein [Hydrococcus sp. CSU_1_8]
MVFGHRLQRRTENRKTSSNYREIVEYRIMSIDKKELIRRISNRVGKETGTVEEVVDATFNEIYQSLKQGESVNLRDFGTFYVRVERESWAFKFNPSQRLRKLFGWSSTYKGDL